MGPNLVVSEQSAAKLEPHPTSLREKSCSQRPDFNLATFVHWFKCIRFIFLVDLPHHVTSYLSSYTCLHALPSFYHLALLPWHIHGDRMLASWWASSRPQTRFSSAAVWGRRSELSYESTQTGDFSTHWTGKGNMWVIIRGAQTHFFRRCMTEKHNLLGISTFFFHTYFWRLS